MGGFRVCRLSFAYNQEPVFKDFRLETAANPVLLRGPSGCGKTTLLKLVTGNLLADNGAQLPKYGRRLLVLQEDALFPWLSGTDNLTKILGTQECDLAEHPMFDVVRDFIHKPACAMSFGQRRLIELFRAVLFAPDFLCLDEPFNYLDPESRRSARTHILALRESGIQLMISSHYSEDFKQLDQPVYTFSGHLPVSELTSSDV